jgi:hypothetical protein
MHCLRRHIATLLIHHGAGVKRVHLAVGHSAPVITLKTRAGDWPGADAERGRSWTRRSAMSLMCAPSGAQIRKDARQSLAVRFKAWQPVSAVVHELDGEVEIFGFEQVDDLLEIILLLR